MRFCILHTPRQMGKTSTLMALAEEHSLLGECACPGVNVEPGQTAREDVH
ncbi:MAG: hypothetical protein OXN89_04970 [Bryobacterales bacterium]|nr:hypothetical protein [Bryobacterales bacterium]